MPYMYILECADRSLYVGSTKHLDYRVAQHNCGEGAAYTRTRLPVRLLYFEEFVRVDDAYLREKQVQGWSRAKRLALVNRRVDHLPELSRKQFASQSDHAVTSQSGSHAGAFHHVDEASDEPHREQPEE